MPIPPSPPRAVTVSIVSHGQFLLIRPLLEQLGRLCEASVAKVVLTINIPEDDAVEDIHLPFPVERLENRVPKGFGANHNAAFRHCATPWFLVLNPDIRLDSDVLVPLLAQATPASGILTPRILEPGKSAPEQHRHVITPLEIVSRRRPRYMRPATPDWIPGLFMLFRADAYAEVRGFDERFFMYGEDFDICARTRLAGWELQVAEDLAARHEARRASHRSAKHLWWHLTSLLRVWGSRTFWRYWQLCRLRRMQERGGNATQP